MAAPRRRGLGFVSGWAYKLGRGLQLAALLTLPFSMWVGWIGHNEEGSILILIGSLAAFWGGYGLTRLGVR